MASLLMALQGAVLVILGVVLLVRTMIDGGSDVGRSVTFDVLLLIFAAGAGVVALALWRGSRSARIPTVLWNLFAILVGLSLARGGAPALGVAALVVALVTLAMGVAAPLNS